MARVNGYKLREAIRKYRKGELLKVIIYQYNLSQQTLHRALKARGYPLRNKKRNGHGERSDNG